MAIPADTLAKLEQLPDDKLQIIISLVDQFTLSSIAEAQVDGPVLNQEEIDALIQDIRAGIVG